MKLRYLAASAVVTLALASAASASSHWIKGTVTKVDKSAQKLTIRHGPIKKFDMEDGMTMVFRVKDPTMLDEVKPGENIQFDADRIEGKFTVIEIIKNQ